MGATMTQFLVGLTIGFIVGAIFNALMMDDDYFPDDT